MHHFQKSEKASGYLTKQDGHSHLDNTETGSIEVSEEYWKGWSNCKMHRKLPNGPNRSSTETIKRKLTLVCNPRPSACVGPTDFSLAVRDIQVSKERWVNLH